MKRDTSNPTTLVEDCHRGLVSLAALEAAAAQMQTPKRRYRVAIVNCDSTSRPKQTEAHVLEYAAAVRS
jgi:hypothetical protein